MHLWEIEVEINNQTFHLVILLKQRSTLYL